MKILENPFALKGYHGKDYFCDREEELQRLLDAQKQGIDITMLAIRRMGKTGLIHHFFNETSPKNDIITIYFDVFATQNLSDFTNEFASAILYSLPKSKKIANNFINYIKGFNPLISFDSFSGAPEVSLSFNSIQQNEKSLQQLFQYLENQDKKVVIAIDEFQQVATYPEKNTEALLRTIIQKLKNINFIFCGSNKHMLFEIFNSVKRPFFGSTQTIYLGSIPVQKYDDFIRHHFQLNKRKITQEAIDFILEWTRTHTYYTQSLCHKLFYVAPKNIVLQDVYYACDRLLKEQESVFFQYRNLLTTQQWNLMIAIAKEDKVTQPTSFEFVSRYELGNASSVRRSLLSLIDKEMVIEISTHNEHYYMVYDCFLSRWMAKL